MAQLKVNTDKAASRETTAYIVRKGYTIHRPPNHYHAGATVELTQDEATNKYSHQIEVMPVDGNIKDIASNKAVKKDTVTKK